jgi:hypothetical protein
MFGTYWLILPATKYCGCFKISIINSNGDMIHVCLIVGDELMNKQVVVYFRITGAVGLDLEPDPEKCINLNEGRPLDHACSIHAKYIQ